MPIPGSPPSNTTCPAESSRPLPAVEQAVELLLTSDQWHQAAHLPRLEAALDLTAGDHPPRLEGLEKALDPPAAEIGTIEQAADQLARAVRDHHRARLRQALQARCQVGRLADRCLLASRAAADQVAHHDEPGGDADPHAQRQVAGYP